MRSKTRAAYVAGFVLVAALALVLRHRERSSGISSDDPIGKGHQAQPQASKKAPSLTPDRKTSQRAPLTMDELVAIFEKDGAEAALAAAKSLRGNDRNSQVVFILTYLARIDPEWVAKALADTGLSVTHQGFIVSAVMEHWKDGENALAWASSFTGDLKTRSVGMALRILVRTDPDKALAYVEAMPASNSRSQALADLFSSWGEHNPKAALGHLGRISTDEQAWAIGIIAEAWAGKSPEEAIAWIRTIQDKATSDRCLQRAALSWSVSAPSDAKAWLATLPDDALRAGILESIAEMERNTTHCDTIQTPDQTWKDKPVAEMTVADLRNWGYQDPAGARKHLEQATGETDLSELAITVAAGMTTKETPSVIFQWAQGLNAKAGDAALRLSIISWAGTKPAEAAGAIAQVEPERRPALANALADVWSQYDPAAAAAWAATYPGSDQKTLVRQVLQQWSASEPREAYAWLATLPAGESRDEGISYMITREAPSDPASLAPWIELLSTPGLQKEKRELLDQYSRRAQGE